MLERFFAVTRTSLYEVIAEGDDGEGPVVQKIAQFGQSNVSLGDTLRRGKNSMVAVGKMLIAYTPKTPSGTIERRIEHLKVPACVLGNTSLVCAYFLDYDTARRHYNEFERIAASPRWRKESEKVLLAIGTNHPVFYIFEDPEFQLFG